MVEKMLSGIEVRLNTYFFELIWAKHNIAEKNVYTGCIDEYFGYRQGHLNYRSGRFETEELPKDDFQGNAVVNYSEREVSYTRIISTNILNSVSISLLSSVGNFPPSGNLAWSPTILPMMQKMAPCTQSISIGRRRKQCDLRRSAGSK